MLCPEQETAFYGGDPDNFTFPRYDLDVTFFRVYEDGKPYQPKHFLSWNPEGCKEGDLIFVSGHPGSTNRMNTFAQMDFLRTTQYPRSLKFLAMLIGALEKYSARGGEETRRAKDVIFVELLQRSATFRRQCARIAARSGCVEECAIGLLRRVREMAREPVEQNRRPAVGDRERVAPQPQCEPEPEIRGKQRIRTLARQVRSHARDPDHERIERLVEVRAAQLHCPQ